MYREYYNLYKQADAIGEQLRSIPGSVATNMLMGNPNIMLGPNSAMTSPVDLLAGGIGVLGNAADKKEIKKYNKTESDAYLPGVAAYRDAKRRKYTEQKVQKDKYKKYNQVHDNLAHLTYPIIGMIGGNMLGAKLFPRGDYGVPPQILGSVVGGLAGAGVDNYASILARAKATAAGNPTFKERKEYYDDPNRLLKTYLLPGYSSYHATRNAMASDIL